MRMQSREKRVVVLGAVVALGIVGWVYVASPMQQRWDRAARGLAASRSELETLRHAARDRSEYGDSRERLASLVFDTPDLGASQRVIPALINQVEGLGQRRQLQITRYEPLPVKVEESYAVYSLTLTFRSDLAELVEFLKDVQAARPVINVRRLHVVPPGPSSETTDLTAEVLLSTYAVERITDTEDQTAEAESGGEEAG